MQVIILAAGLGSRLKEKTTHIPKALISVCGKPLIDYALQFTSHPNITDRFVVTGYCHDQVAKHLSDTHSNIHIRHNADFKDGNFFSMLAAINDIHDDLLIMNTDHIYPKSFLNHIITHATGISAICDFDRQLGADDMKIKLNSDKQITTISKQLTDFDGGYIGMTFCKKDSLAAYQNMATSIAKTNNRHAYVEMVLDQLANESHPIHTVDASGDKWFEIDTQSDLSYTEDELRKMEPYL